MGFQQGNLLEPACGTGNFIGLLPADMAGSKAYGVEIDSISGRIAQQLYQNASISVKGFETVQMPDSFLMWPSATSPLEISRWWTGGMTSTIG